MLQQPRVPPTGQRQAVEVHIKWREVLDYKRELLRCLSLATGWGVDKLDADMQRPLYMRPQVRAAGWVGVGGHRGTWVGWVWVCVNRLVAVWLNPVRQGQSQ